MIKQCITNNDEFGILTNIDSDISRVGCTASVEKVIKNYPDGSFDIIVRGTDRFKTKSTVFVNDGLLEVEIMPYIDSGNNVHDDQLYDRTVIKLLDVLKIADIKLDNDFWANLTIAELKSFKIAEKAGLTLKQQQNILALQDETLRLNFIYDHLSKVETIIEKNKIAHDLMAGDGYLNR